MSFPKPDSWDKSLPLDMDTDYVVDPSTGSRYFKGKILGQVRFLIVYL